MQEALIHFAAPTLRGIKSGNIFTFNTRDRHTSFFLEKKLLISTGN